MQKILESLTLLWAVRLVLPQWVHQVNQFHTFATRFESENMFLFLLQPPSYVKCHLYTSLSMICLLILLLFHYTLYTGYKLHSCLLMWLWEILFHTYDTPFHTHIFMMLIFWYKCKLKAIKYSWILFSMANILKSHKTFFCFWERMWNRATYVKEQQ